MNIRYLEIMEAIAETGSFTGASRKLFITQSAVSHAVAELEEQAGTALFERLPKGVRLTACGFSLLEEAQGILIACRNLDRRLPHLEENTPIHIVSSITIATSLLPAILAQFRERYPDVRVFVKIASADAVIDSLRHGEADLAFWEGTAPEGEFAMIPLGSYQLRAVCAPGFRISQKRLSLQQLCRYPLLLREEGSAVRDTFDRILMSENLKAEPVWESVNSLALVKAAESGLGIAILPQSIVEQPLSANRLRLVGLKASGLENQMLVLCHKNQYRTKPLQQLLRTIQE